MIAKPLVWDEGIFTTTCGRYRIAPEAGRWPKWHAWTTGYNTIGRSQNLGSTFKSQAEAQAACERHHQLSVAKMLTRWAREVLADIASIMSDPAFFVLKEAIDEAERAEQEDKP